MFNLKAAFVVSLVMLFVMISKADNFKNAEMDVKVTEINEQESSATDIGTSRVKHHYLLPLYGGSALLGLGGLNALAVLFAIKVKIIVVGFIAALAIFYYSKYLKNCGNQEIIRDTNPYESYGPSAYSNSLPAGIGYPGTDRFNPPAISSIDHDDDHYHDDHEPIPSIIEPESKSASSPSIVEPESQFVSSPIIVEPESKSASSSLPPPSTDKSEIISRMYSQMRQFSNPIFDNIDWSDMAFNLLGLDTDECRRRFTCELDFGVKQIPFSSNLFNSDSPAFLNKYRESAPDINKATAFSDCALFYGECKYL